MCSACALVRLAWYHLRRGRVKPCYHHLEVPAPPCPAPPPPSLLALVGIGLWHRF